MSGKAYALVGGRILTPTDDIPSGTLVIRGSHIEAIGASEQVTPPPGIEVVDVNGKIVCPGFVEIHTHGGRGITMGIPKDSPGSPTSTVAGDIQALSERLPECGITSYIPTFSTMPFETSLQILEEAPAAMQNTNHGAEVLGLQMEGPYFNPAPKGPYDRYPPRGAQPAEYFRTPSVDELHQMWEISQGNLRMMCLSPEVEGAIELVREMNRLGIIASGAHSLASYAETLAAVEAGMTTVTHMYNGMRRQDHREPGIIEAALVCDEVTIQIITDGIHVHPPAFEVALRCKGKDRIAITTDNTAFAGMPNGMYEDELGRQLEKTDDYVRIVDGVLAGSVMLMNRQLRTLTQRMEVSLQDAIYMATLVPARLIGVETKGSLAPGKDADVLVVDDDLNVHLAYCKGILAYHSDVVL